ncbi:MAG: cell division protein ZapA [Candidatus Magnetobacterium sp. LHC-1]|uniref:Cell division protein ZapA n=1 Tax=Candidatus Magnetobacterium casense TaxID=1455061 RepID=A0ABS6RTQ1_9BACT|nr:cell division protein ZapA [Candidatus Magnetobacterium casensis]MBF0338035.1 cell division protein ZapA [Nitrospirota bacterium]MBF0606622.1 cell division protein ZapA [Nitrospirota bacterium]MBV6340002.1 cell division protein ZapA [Candidatus Magnetobacterium casensis]
MASAEVYILGQKYILKGEEPEEYIRALAVYVDKKLQDIQRSAPMANQTKTAILAALGIADELFKLKEAHEALTKNIETSAEDLSKLLD